jgi:hAT family C-terminal dimerisation region
MASSVSSERAFSSTGITISKCRNRLKGDLVEPLQCMKYIYHNNLLFQEVQVSSEIEKELDGEEVIDVDMDSDEVLQEADGFSWDSIIVDNDDDASGDGED